MSLRALIAMAAVWAQMSGVIAAEHGSAAVDGFEGVELPGGVVAFKGIRFGQATSGELRWKPPVPAAYPTAGSTVAAKDFGPACFQARLPAESIYADEPRQMSEDCLFLNIWKPAHASKAPVMVWIHGGALRYGNVASGLNDGSQLAHKGVVVVTLNYRLGVFGYLAHPELTAESSHSSSGNYGLLDQVEALHWVRDHIAAFGGDPANVTVFGESAGGLSIIELMASPLARGLFQKAMVQSGYMVSNLELRQPSLGQPSAEAVGEYVAKGVGATSLAALRAMDADTLLQKAVATGFDPEANIDGWVLPRQIVESFDRGEQARVPVIIGFNAGEIRSLRYLLPPLPATAAEYEAKVRHLYGDLAQRYLQLYPSTDIERSALAASRDGLYGWTSERVVRKQTQLGMPAYLYFFEHQYPVEVTLHLEAFHASELPYEFGVVVSGGAGLPKSWPRPPDDAQERALSEAFMNYITEFARTGKPSAAGQPDWHPYSDDEAFLDIRDKPYPAKHIMPGMFALQEEVVTRRRRAGTENWYVNVGLAAPVLPEAGK